MYMNAVNVAELRNRLSHYLRLVRKGARFLVRDRDRVVARLEPAGDEAGMAGDDAERLAALEAEGLLRRGRGRITAALLARRPRVEADVVAALLEERREGR
jgi:antitoxin (DNA-binding transcriptional repressor) of toxin-antitoxin stability system